MTIETLLFDFDGTLADTNELIARSHLHVLNRYFPGEYNRESVQAFNGPSLKEVYSKLKPDCWEQLVKEYREYNEQHHDEYVYLFPEVKETLKQLKKQGIKLGIVSTKMQPILGHGLRFLEIESYFDVVIGGNDCVNNKPDPAPIFFALERLNSKVETTMMIGDNWQDLEAARRAHVRSVFVEWSEKSLDQMLAYQPNKILKSMLELTTWVEIENNGGTDS